MHFSISLSTGSLIIFAFAPSKVMARRVYRSRSCSQDVENEWSKASSDRRGAAGGLRGWDDDSDDGKFQLKAGALDAKGHGGFGKK